MTGARAYGKELDAAISFWASLAKLLKDNKANKALVVVDLSGVNPTMAAYQLAENPKDFGWERFFKVAIVDINDESYKSNEFTVTVAKNRGYLVEIFKAEKEAERWLLS